jgi:phosphonate transport system ATP-binding protein
MDTLKEINRHYGITIIANLHQLEHARNYCSRIIGINQGQIVYDGEPARLNDGLIREIYYGAKKDDRLDERKHIGILPVFPEAVNA